jgi:hypothetical protein
VGVMPRVPSVVMSRVHIVFHGRGFFVGHGVLVHIMLVHIVLVHIVLVHIVLVHMMFVLIHFLSLLP